MPSTTISEDVSSAFDMRMRLGAGEAGTVAIKDCIDIAGYPTRAGSKSLEHVQAAPRHADVVARLLDAGWCIVGKTKLHELAFGMSGINDYAGTPVNPRAPERIPGGSSSGSAVAVANGDVDLALGTDTGGSIRLPAACCGVVGLKPTFGLVSRSGVHPRESSLDCVGPMARTVAVIAEAMRVLAPDLRSGAGRGSSGNSSTSTPRLGVASGVGADPIITDAVYSAVRASGASYAETALGDLLEPYAAAIKLMGYEMWSTFGHMTGQHLLQADVEARLAAASAITREDLAAAERTRQVFSAHVDHLLARFDALVLPTLPCLPPTIASVRQGASILDLSVLVRPFNLSGHPALTLPLPIPGSRLEAGLQLIGKKGEDHALCDIAALLEEAIRDNRKTLENPKEY